MEILKRVTIPASPSQVWNALAHSEATAKWWGKGIYIEPKLGGKFFEPWTDQQGGEHLATGTVTLCREPELIEFTWREKEWDPQQETVCMIKLVPTEGEAEAEQTMLILQHGGWDAFPPERGGPLCSGFSSGWDHLLSQLSEYAASAG